jgi:hypothetical protein
MVKFPDGSSRVETWGGNGWEYGGADVFSVSMAPDASPAILRKHRVPKEYWSDIVLEEDRQEQARKSGGALTALRFTTRKTIPRIFMRRQFGLRAMFLLYDKLNLINHIIQDNAPGVAK